MSVIVTFCLHDGIIMAADSRVTLTKTYQDGRQEISYRDDAKKIFQFGNRDIGILWCGNAQVGEDSVFDYLDGLFNRLSKKTTIKEIATKINDECNERVQGESICCYIAGYENGIQCLYQVANATITHKNLDPQLGIPSICVVWDGQKDISRDIIRNKEKLDIGDKLVDESDVPHFTLDEGIKFAEAMLKRSCEERQDCGEPIRSLEITPKGLRWVHA